MSAVTIPCAHGASGFSKERGNLKLLSDSVRYARQPLRAPWYKTPTTHTHNSRIKPKVLCETRRKETNPKRRAARTKLKIKVRQPTARFRLRPAAHQSARSPLPCSRYITTLELQPTANMLAVAPPPCRPRPPPPPPSSSSSSPQKISLCTFKNSASSLSRLVTPPRGAQRVTGSPTFLDKVKTEKRALERPCG